MMDKRDDTDQRLSGFAIFAFSVTLWPLTIAQLSLAFVAPYYSQAFGLSLAFIGMVMTVGRLIDVAADLGVAWGSDRTRTRWGRRKPWVVAGLCLYIPATILLFVPPATMSTERYVATIMLFFLSWTMAFIPYLSQGTELSKDYTVKNRINLIQSAVMIVSLLSAFVLPLLLVDPRAAFLREGLANGLSNVLPNGLETYLRRPQPTGTEYFRQSMLVISVMALLPLVVTLPIYIFRVKELPVQEAVGKGSFTSALGNPVFLRFAIGYVLMMAGYMGRAGLMPFILTTALRLPDSYLFYMMLLFVSSLAVTPFWARLLKRYSRIQCMVLAAIIEATGLGALFLMPPDSPILTAFAFIIMGLPGQTLLMIPYLIAADSADYALWKTGKDSRAIHVSLCSLIVKLGAVCAGLWVWLAGVAGFVPGKVDQSAGIVWLMKTIGLGIPVLLLIAGCFVIIGFPVTQRRHAAIQRRLALRARGV
jgi:GPH family glycoside/pentoside/hexuronide:cation symporter